MHQSPDAEKMRAEIVRLVADRRTEDEIVERYVSEYASGFSACPKGARFAVLTLSLGAAWILLFLARRRRAMRLEMVGVGLPAIPENELEWQKNQPGSAVPL